MEADVNVFQSLKERGFVYQTSDEKVLEQTLEQSSLTFYIGIDPTGDSLHCGHLIPLLAAQILSKAGHKPIIVIGGGTAKIGDPSGKDALRSLKTPQELDHNGDRLKKQIEKLFDGAPVTILNNKEWIDGLGYIELLREIGVHFSVNHMLSFEAYKRRLEGSGLSFIEFNYQILQSYDFYHLYKTHGCSMQIGGSDQWGNMTAGMELIRRALGPSEEAPTPQVLTVPLVMLSNGKKMGKTESGSLFLDPEKTPVFDFFQYWRNIPDKDLLRFLLLLTDLPAQECRDLSSAANPNPGKERLAYEFTARVHGKEEADKALRYAQSLFSSSSNAPAEAPRKKVSLPSGEVQVCDIFVLAGLCQKRSDAKRLCEQGGAKINGEKEGEPFRVLTPDELSSGELTLQAGKKRHLTIEFGEKE